MSTETTDTNTPADDGVQNPEGTPTEKPRSLEELLSGLDDSARDAVLGEVSKARTEAKNLRSRLRDAKKTPDTATSSTDPETVAKLREAEANLAKWQTATVEASVRALAAQSFANPDDARLFLSNIEDYVGDDGIVDEGAIRADLASVLKARPYLAGDPGRRGPKPDHTQASGGNGGTPNGDPASAFQNWLTSRI